MTFSYEKMYMIEEVLDKLINYTISHFTYEEKLMESANYPFLKEQKKAHESFFDRIISFKERFENGENISSQLRNNLQLWAIHHIKKGDSNYTEFIHKNLTTIPLPKEFDFAF